MLSNIEQNILSDRILALYNKIPDNYFEFKGIKRNQVNNNDPIEILFYIENYIKDFEQVLNCQEKRLKDLIDKQDELFTNIEKTDKKHKYWALGLFGMFISFITFFIIDILITILK